MKKGLQSEVLLASRESDIEKGDVDCSFFESLKKKLGIILTSLDVVERSARTIASHTYCVTPLLKVLEKGLAHARSGPLELRLGHGRAGIRPT
jgi:hypothetical protein